MPSTGMPSSSSSGSSFGAPSAYTDAGPPDRIRPLGLRRRTSSAPTWWGSSSENTPHSRTRRAMSWEYCPPKSRTTTSSTARGARTSVAFSSTTCGAARDAVTTASVIAPRGRGGPRSAACGQPRRWFPGSSRERRLRLGVLGLRVRRRGRAARAHADLLCALQLLALGLQRRGDHQLRTVELRDVAVAGRRHRGPQAAHDVERAVVLVGGAGEDLLERPVLHRLHARTARERRVERRHAPVETAPRRLVGPGEG